MLDFVATWCSRINKTFFAPSRLYAPHGKIVKQQKTIRKTGSSMSGGKRGNKYARSMQGLATDIYSIDSKTGKTPKAVDEPMKP